MAKTLDQRLAAAKLIKDETIPNANTAPRVGGAMEDMNNAWNEELGEINVTTAFPPTSGYHTPETARAAVPESYKRKGRTIAYQTAAGTWVKEQYRGDSTAAWTTASNWFPILMAADQNVYNVTTQNPLAAGEYYNPTTARAAVPNQIRKLNLGLKYLSGYKEVDTLTITGPALTDGSISIFLNGVKNTASPVIYAGDTAIDIATKIRLMTWAGWTVGGTPGTAVVTFTRTTYDPVSAPTFSNTAGITANFVRTSTGQTPEWIHEEFIGPSIATWTTATNWSKIINKNEFEKLVNRSNIIDPISINWVRGSYINSTGTTTINSSFSYSENYIDISDAISIDITSMFYSEAKIAFYDENLNFISYLEGALDALTVVKKSYGVPLRAKYVRVSCITSFKDFFILSYTSNSDIKFAGNIRAALSSFDTTKRSSSKWGNLISFNYTTGLVTFPKNVIYILPYNFSNHIRIGDLQIQFDVTKEWGVACIKIPSTWLTKTNGSIVVNTADVIIHYYGDSWAMTPDYIPLYFWNRNTKNGYSPYFSNLISRESIDSLNITSYDNSNEIIKLKGVDDYSFDIQQSPSFSGIFKISGTGYWSGTDGEAVSVVNDSNYNYMSLIDVIPGSRMRLSGFYSSGAGFGICAYIDSNGNYLGRLSSSVNFATGEYDVILPNNVYKIGLYFNNAGGVNWPIEKAKIIIGEYIVKLKSLALPDGYEELLTLPTRVTNLEEVEQFCYDIIRQVTYNYNLHGKGVWQSEGQVVGQPVILSSNSSYDAQPVRTVKYGDTVSVKGVYSSGAGVGCFAVIDSSGNYLGRKNFGNAVESDAVLGNYKFLIDNPNVSSIGWYIDNRQSSTFPPYNAKMIINEGDMKLSITETYKNLLEKTLEISKYSEMDIVSQMFNRGKTIKKAITKKKCILIWGQSNADGRNTLDTAPQYLIDLNYVMQKALFCDNSNGTFVPWDNKVIPSSSYQRWGFKAIVAYYFSVIDNEDIYFINLTVGGTSMAETGTTTSHWTPFFEKLLNTDTSLLRNLEDRTRKAIELLSNEFEIVGVIGHQGEGDNDSISSEQYHKNLLCFISYLRGVVGNPYLPFVSGTIPRLSSSYNYNVEKAQLDAMAEDFYTHYVDLSQGTMFDGLHFDAATSESFGIAVYNKLKEYFSLMNLRKLQ